MTMAISQLKVPLVDHSVGDFQNNGLKKRGLVCNIWTLLCLLGAFQEMRCWAIKEKTMGGHNYPFLLQPNLGVFLKPISDIGWAEQLWNKCMEISFYLVQNMLIMFHLSLLHVYSKFWLRRSSKRNVSPIKSDLNCSVNLFLFSLKWIYSYSVQNKIFVTHFHHLHNCNLTNDPFSACIAKQ